MTTRHAADRFSSEDGFTLIELLVSMVILVIGIFGLVSSVDGSRTLTNVSEHEDVAAQVADRELDAALTVPYDNLSLTQTPPTGGATADDATQWNGYLTSTNLLPQPTGGRNCSSFWTSATASDATANNETTCIVSCPSVSASTGCPAVGTVPPTGNVSVPVASAQIVRLKVYRYVTWVNDTGCGASCPNLSSNGYKGDYKRVTIAVVPVTQSVSTTPTATWPSGTGTGLPSLYANQGPRQPVIVSATRPDPTVGKGNAEGSVSPCTLVKAITC